jgi:hypothetical protein
MNNDRDIFDVLADLSENKGAVLSALGMVFSGIAGIISFVNTSYVLDQQDKAMKKYVDEAVTKRLGG